MNELGGHVTMLIDDECWTFPLPSLAHTRVEGWGPGQIGVFEQSSVPPFVALEYENAVRRWKRWRWLTGGSRPQQPAIHLVIRNRATYYFLADCENVVFDENEVEVNKDEEQACNSSSG